MWKKGSVESAKSSGANKLLDHEGIRWAKGLGCTRYDMVGIDRTAVAAPLGGEKRGTRIGPDLYKMQFGGMPVLLPESRLWIPNPLLRAAYSLLLRVTLGRYT
jgi:lipid II:glycine glycyltransferase (peptidoglycan interpeptide bridge formation enzyme)